MDKYSRAEAALERLRFRIGAYKMARELKISPQAVYKWEVVPLTRLKDICRLYGGTIQTYRPDAFEGWK